jgi:hypothetical protein
MFTARNNIKHFSKSFLFYKMQIFSDIFSSCTIIVDPGIDAGQREAPSTRGKDQGDA